VNGTATVTHVITSNVTHGDAADFSTPASQEIVGYQASRATVVSSITATGTLTLPAAGTDMRVILNGTSVIALTVPVPTKDMDGTVLMIIGNGVAAHTLTFTGGLSGAGTSYDVITTNSAAPIAMQAVAANGLWNSFVATPMSGTVTNITGGVA
jgi:putative intracellular protease/amidase